MKCIKQRKETKWYLGMKVHAGVDAGTGYVHTITATAANVHNSRELSILIRQDDEVVYGDSGYLRAEAQEAIKSDEHLSKVEFSINRRPSCLKTKSYYKGENWDKEIEKRKSSIRSKLEHVSLIIEREFGYGKTVYRGLMKKLNRLYVLFSSANILMCSRAKRTLACI